jgi:hypothetical protein
MTDKITKKAKKTSPIKKKKQEISVVDKSAIDKWRKRYNERVKPLKFKKVDDRTLTHTEQDSEKFWARMLETTGSPDVDFFQTILTQVRATLPQEEPERATNFVAAFMHGLKPQDEMEGVLIAQMAGIHNLIMEYMRKAVIPEQFLGAAEDYTNRAYKLLNVFLRQVEALQKYRGKTSQQKVIVEHVHIHEGGQAVVGHIESRPRGEGDGTKNRG